MAEIRERETKGKDETEVARRSANSLTGFEREREGKESKDEAGGELKLRQIHLAVHDTV
jgi:hypothetical protein